MKFTKTLALVAIIAAASTANAGNMTDPIDDPEVINTIIDEGTTGGTSSGGLIIPLLILALVAAAAS